MHPKTKTLPISLLTIIVWGFIHNPGYMKAQGSVTLELALSSALQDHPALKLSQQEIDVADSRVWIGNAGMLPNVQWQGSIDQGAANIRQEFLNGTENQRNNAGTNVINAGANLQWVLFDGFRMFHLYRQLQIWKESAQLDYKLRAEQIILQTMQAYYDWIFAESLIQFRKQIQEISIQRVNWAYQRYQTGSGSKSEWLQAKIDAVQDSTRLQEASLLLDQAKIGLHQTSLLPIEMMDSPTDSLQITQIPEPGPLLEEVLERNIQVLLSQQNLIMALQNLKLSRSAHYPSIAFNGSYQFTNLTSEAGFLLSNRNYGWNVGLQAQWTIFQGLQAQKAQKTAALSVQSQRLSMELLLHDLEGAFSQAYADFVNIEKVYYLQSNAQQMVKENMDIASERYRLGSISGLEFRNVQNQFLQAKEQLLQANIRAKVAELRLLQLSGRLL